jgi:hypothetical protein
MGTPTQHALLSASSAHRWLACTASPRFEEQFAEGTSPYAEEGTLAHSICELFARKQFTPKDMSPQKFTARLKKLKNNELFSEEMLDCAQGYVDYLKLKSMQMYDSMPYVTQEVRVDFSKYVPDGFGTCDCIMIGGDTLHITDYKHGKGVKVEAVNNPQMRLYALGALEKYKPFYGNSIKYVSMGIYQPRISRDEPSEDKLTVSELMTWGEIVVKPLADIAYTGTGATFVPGEHCRFCRGKAQCRARADQNTALEEFKQFAVPTKAQPGQPILSDAEIGDLLVRGANLEQWMKDLREYATQAILEGKTIDGWKLVEGKSNRKITDTDKLVELLKENDYDEALLYERKPLTLTNYEKLVGKKRFAEIAGELVVKPKGAPTLAPLSDKREPFNSATTDFAGVSENV